MSITRFAAFIALAVAAGLNGMAVADTTADTDDGFNYTLANGVVTINYYSNATTESLVVPSTIGGYPVTTVAAIDYGSTDTNLKEIYIPSSVTTIGNTLVSANIPLESLVIANPNVTLPSVLVNAGSSAVNAKLKAVFFIGMSASVTAPSFSINSSVDKYKYDAGVVYVYFKNESDPLPVHMFVYGYYSANRTVAAAHLNYLLSGLQNYGKDKSQIAYIDFSGLQNNVTCSLTETDLADAGVSGVGLISTGTTTIADLVNYTSVTAGTSVTYIRCHTSGWNSVCLPFDIAESSFPANTKIYTLSGATADAITLTHVTDNDGKVTAGTPCYIYSEADTWQITATIAADATAGEAACDGWSLKGSFEESSIGADRYKLSSDGTAFGKTTSAAKVYPYRCYLESSASSQSAPSRLSCTVEDNAESSILLLPNDGEPQRVRLYDLMGRPRTAGASGIFVKSNR